MTGRRVAVAALATVVLLVVAWALEVVVPRHRDDAGDGTAGLVQPGTELRALTITRGGQPIRLLLGDDETWRLTAPTLPRDTPADPAAATDVLARLRSARIAAVVASAPGPVSWAPFGLAPARVELKWGREEASRVELGGLAPDGTHSYARTADGRLVLVSRELLLAVDRGVSDLRSKAVISADPDTFRRLEVVRQRSPGVSERLLFARDDERGGDPEQWRMLLPEAIQAGPRLRSIVSKLAGLGAESFGAEDPQPADLADVGLSAPAVTVLVDRAAGQPITLTLGDTDEATGLAWAWSGRGPLVRVRGDLRADLLLPAADYGEERIVRLPLARVSHLRIAASVSGARAPRRDGRAVPASGDASWSLDVRRQPDGTWQAAGSTLPHRDASAVAELLQALYQARCRGFLARRSVTRAITPPGAMQAGALEPGDVAIAAEADATGEAPRTASVHAREKTHGAERSWAIDVTDGLGREESCVAPGATLDAVLAQARELAQVVLPSASDPAAPSGGPP